MPCELCAITPKSVELAPVIAPFHAQDALELLDTATGAPASGPAPSHEPEPETPGRRPALRHSISPLVAVSRCARVGLAVVFRRVFPPAVRKRGPSVEHLLHRDRVVGRFR